MRFIRPFREILFLATVDTRVAEIDRLEKLFRESVIFRKGYYFWPPKEKNVPRVSPISKGLKIVLLDRAWTLARFESIRHNSPCLNYFPILTCWKHVSMSLNEFFILPFPLIQFKGNNNLWMKVSIVANDSLCKASFYKPINDKLQCII